MTAYDRKSTSVEPSHIAGADLPDFMRPHPNRNAIVGAVWASLIPVGIAVWQLWVHFDAVTFWAAGL